MNGLFLSFRSAKNGTKKIKSMHIHGEMPFKIQVKNGSLVKPTSIRYETR